MFLGTYHPRLDEKGRLILPAKYRDELAGGVVIVKGQEHSLYVWPTPAFEAKTAQMNAAVTDATKRNFSRVLFAGAHDDTPDRQGRITIPPHLRAYAGLTRDLAVVGANDHVEIWDHQAWEAFLAQEEPTYATQSKEVYPGVM